MCELCKAKARVLELECELKEYKNFAFSLTDTVRFFVDKNPANIKQLRKMMKQLEFVAKKLPNAWTMFNQDEKAKERDDD